ncbi:MAG: glucokinase [Ectothiorhodospiraceae bacterium]|nr:glucokinase [Ectothiorhodospiraceae bacterium]MCH8506354.1 glucokinase [Ectothiorhodospiraceae bacterium]
MHILVADIGGTQARFRLLEGSHRTWWIRHEASWPSHRFQSLAEAVECCLAQLSRVERADIDSTWLAVAGPVRDGEVSFTNLPWHTDTESLRARLGLPRVHLVNDLEALAHAVPDLKPEQQLTVQRGSPGGGCQLVIASGTGLGVAGWHGSGRHTIVLASEGGHCDLAPVTDRQMELLLHLRQHLEHVSYERVLSGPGLATLHAFADRLAKGGKPTNPDPPDISPAHVVELAQQEDPVALTAIGLFTELLGSFAGNAALQWAATGGVYLAGGVAIRLHPHIVCGSFVTAFTDKGRMSPLMQRIPVTMIADHQAGLEGITHLAIHHPNRRTG